MAKVAFIGTGIMGREMALRLIDAGHDLSVFNRTRDKTRPLENAGAKIKDSPANAATDAEIIISMVADDAASRNVWLGDNGVLSNPLRPGVTAVECSTLSYDWVIDLQGKLTSSGIDFTDCPVTGGPDGAREGTLRVLAGGASETLEKIRPLLMAFSREIIHFGPVGTGTCYKLIVNLIGAVQAAALAEGILLAESAGLDLEKVAYALKLGSVASPHVKYLLDRMLDSAHDEVYFSAALRHKDASYAIDLARNHHLVLSTSEAATDLFEKTLKQDLGHKNSSVILEALRKLHEQNKVKS